MNIYFICYKIAEIVFVVFAFVHIPVLLQETIDILSPKNGEKVLDCTFGGGGHTQALLGYADCYVLGLDRDPEAEIRAIQIKQKYKERFDFKLLRFSELVQLDEKFDCVLFDLGVSSFQLDNENRGFSFSKNANLDMRMSPEGVTAFEVINTFSEHDLSTIIWNYGNEPKARKIAAEIVKQRKNSPIQTTFQLADLIRSVIGFDYQYKKYSRVDSATKTFQAIRIFVNDELKEISTALNNLITVLNNKARIVIISFHALEDRIVKNWANERKQLFFPINKGILQAGEGEILKNPRSRSAVLRGFVYNQKPEETEDFMSKTNG